MKLFELFATLELQTNKFNDGINKAQGMAQNFAGKVQSAVSAGTVALGNLMARGVEVAANAVKNIASQALNLTGQLEQNVGGSLAVFGTWAETVQEKSAKAFETMGLSAADYLATANQMGSLFKGAGFTTAEAMELTTEAMQRAADVASIMGIDAAWAMESIAGAAKGNFTMMDNLGVAINETTLEMYALEKGITKSTRAMTTQEKVGLAMEMFLERTAEYAGNYAKENDTLAGAMQTAKAALDNLLSGVEDFSETDFVDAVENMFRVVTRNVTKIVPRLTSSFAEIAQRAIPKIKTAFTNFWNNDLPGIATQGVNLVINGINQLFGTDIKPIEVIDLPTVEEITGKLKTLWDGVTEATSELFTWTLGLFTPPDESIDHMGSLATWWYGTALPFIKETFNWTIGIFQPPGDGVDPDGYIAQWWENTALPFLSETCKWTLNMFLPPDENGEITPESVITGWWENVAGVVAGVCQWTLNLFSGVAGTDADGNEPQTIIASWWGNIVESIVSACEWALGIFQTPVETVDDVVDVVAKWWSGMVGAVESACVWFLSMFKAPQSAEDGKGPGSIMATWWNDVVDSVVSACQWFLGLFSGVSSTTTSDGKTSTPADIVLSWWKDTINSIVAVCRWAIGSFFGVANVASDGSMKSPKDIVSAWWNTTKSGIIGLCTWVINSFSEVEESEGENAPESIVGTWWKTAKGAVIAVCQWTLGLFSGVSNGTDADGNDITPESIVSTWWGTVKDAVVSACSWTLGLFTGVNGVTDANGNTTTPTDIVEGWWGTVVNSVRAACQWTLGLFLPPTDDIDADGSFSAWWANTAAPALRDICTWTIGLFMPPTEEDIDGSGAIYAWWYNTAMPALDNICQWTLSLFGAPTEDVESNGAFSKWWIETASPAIQSICTWTLSLFNPPNEDGAAAGSQMSTWWENVAMPAIEKACVWTLGLFNVPVESAAKVASVVGGWWLNNVKLVELVCGWTLRLFEDPKETPQAIKAIVSQWWDGVSSSVEAACTWVLQLFGVPTETIDEIKTKVSGWWKTVVGAVESVCVFAARFFGFSTTDVNGEPISEAIAAWWAYMVSLFDRICEWAFKVDPAEWITPTSEQVLGWWNSVKGSLEETIKNAGGIIVSVGKLVLGESLETSALGKLGENVSSFLADLTGAINTALNSGNVRLQNTLSFGALGVGMFTHPVITTITLIIANWETLKATVDVVSTAVTDFLTQTVPEAWNSFVDGIGNLWNDYVVSPITDGATAVADFFAKDIPESWNAFIEKIKTKWGEVTSSIWEAIAAQETYVSSEDAPVVYGSQMAIDANTRAQIAEIMSENSPTRNLSGNSPTRNQGDGGANDFAQSIMHKKAVGLNYVPYNDFPSLLHEGEAVLTKAEATAWRRGENTQSVSIDYDRLGSIVAAAVAEAVSGLTIQMDKQTVGTIVSPVVFREMGRQLGSKRFAT